MVSKSLGSFQLRVVSTLIIIGQFKAITNGEGGAEAEKN